MLAEPEILASIYTEGLIHGAVGDGNQLKDWLVGRIELWYVMEITGWTEDEVKKWYLEEYDFDMQAEYTEDWKIID